MKKFIGIFLAFSVLLALMGCNQAPQQNDPTQPTYDPAIVALVEQPLTWEQINAIPVADDSMTEEQLRQCATPNWKALPMVSIPLKYPPVSAPVKSCLFIQER